MSEPIGGPQRDEFAFRQIPWQPPWIPRTGRTVSDQISEVNQRLSEIQSERSRASDYAQATLCQETLWTEVDVDHYYMLQSTVGRLEPEISRLGAIREELQAHSGGQSIVNSSTQ